MTSGDLRVLNRHRAYRDAGGRGSVAANRPVYVGEDDESAWADAEPALPILWRRFLGEGKIAKGTPEPERFAPESVPGRFLVGGPETAARAIRELRAKAPFDVFNIEPRWAGFAPETVQAGLRRVAERVWPLVNVGGRDGSRSRSTG